MELDDLLKAKSKELKDLQDKRIQSLDDEIRGRDIQLSSLREHYNELKDNFQYNLELLLERDKELGSYDGIITQLNERINASMAEISDLKVELSNTQQKCLENAAKKEEVQRTFQNKILEIEASFEREFGIKEHKLSVELTETARIKQQLEINLADLQEDTERKRREWERNFEEEISALVREHSAKASAYDSKILQNESKLKLVTSEREALRMTVSELESTVTKQDVHISKMEEAVENAEWDVKSFITAQQARISELENQLSKQNEMLDEREIISCKKLSVCEAHLQEKEVIITGLKERHKIEMKEIEKEKKVMVGVIEEMKLRSRCEVAKLEDNLSEANEQVLQLQSRVEEQKIWLETEQQKSARHEVAEKMSEQQFEEKLKETKIELVIKKQDIARYKTELALAVKREESLRSECEQEMKLMRLRCEKAERNAYSSQEGLLKDLTSSRDMALADLKRMKCDKILQEDEIKVLKGQHINHTSENIEESESEVELLKHQNERLKGVIKHMSSEMENIAGQNIPQNEESLSRQIPSSASQMVGSEQDEPRDSPREHDQLREEVMYLRKIILSQKSNELSIAKEAEELTDCKARLEQLERERDRLLELSNNLRAKLNQFQEQQQEKSIPLKEITSRLNTARSLLTSTSNVGRNRRTSTQSQISLLHMSGDTSLNEELSDICRMVESEENRPLSAASKSVAVTGKQLPQSTRPIRASIPPPNTAFRGPAKRNIRTSSNNKPKLRNYNNMT